MNAGFFRKPLLNLAAIMLLSLAVISASLLNAGFVIELKGFLSPFYWLIEAPSNHVLILWEEIIALTRDARLAISEHESLQSQLFEMRAEIERLIAMNGSSPRNQTVNSDPKLDVKPVRFLSRPAESWWESFSISMGALDGLRPGAAVCDSNGLVGRIVNVGDISSEVMMITAGSSLVPVVVEETRDVGVLIGDGNGSIWLDYIPEERPIREGAKLVTPLLGGSLPSGIVIGRVGKSSESHSGYKRYSVHLAADISRMYNLLVIQWKGE